MDNEQTSEDVAAPIVAGLVWRYICKLLQPGTAND
jgi:hypothetical protein